MPWVVGIDEAGYGPNLGPLVQACVGLQMLDGDPHGWETLKARIRRSDEKDDGRVLVDDSKKIYSGDNGFGRLERSILSVFPHNGETFLSFVIPFAFTDDLDVISESWFRGDMPIPYEIDLKQSTPLDERDFFAFLRIVPAESFNRRITQTGSKATVLTDGIFSFLNVSRPMCLGDEALSFICDKLGGRNFYAPILQEAFPEGWPVAEVEGAAESRYRILNVGRDITVTFKPRADGENVCVALASMLAKYVREICMRQFNEFWAKHVPGIRPTAGYPVDAKRFYSEIQEAMIRLGIPADAVWRKK